MSKLSPSCPTGAAEPTDSHHQRISRVMLLQRDLNDKPVPVPRPSAPTATAVARASAALRSHGVEPVGPECTDHVDLVLVLGGDGTILRAFEVARERDIPLVGINTGHVGFLAEADPDGIEQVVADLVAGRYTVETRTTMNVEVISPDGTVTREWALNEAALEKRDRARMIEVAIGVDGQAVSSFGCDAERPVRLARFNEAPFASRLVRKFDLPVEGWRASSSADEAYSAEDEALHQPMVCTADESADVETRRDSSGGTS